MKLIYLKEGLFKINVKNSDITFSVGTRNITRNIAIKRGFLKKISK